MGRYRRNHWAPLPEAKTLEELNRTLLESCRQDEARTVTGRAQTVGEGMLAEREHLLGLAAEGFAIEESSFPKVDGSGCVKVRTNFYSTPLRPGARAQAKKRWRARRRSSNGGKPGAGLPATTPCGRS